MTIRAVIIGFIGVLLISSLTFFNDAIMHHTYMIGNNMPIAVYGTLILMLLIMNPLLKITKIIRPFSAPEFAVILGLTLTVCGIPGSGLMRIFSPITIMPYNEERLNPGFQEKKILALAPQGMLAKVANDNDHNVVVNAFIQGTADKKISVSKVPWSFLKDTIIFWVPLLFLLWIGLLGLSLVVNRQWSDHEHLPYPVVDFTKSILPKPGEAIVSLLKSPLFWLGAIPVIVLYLNNYATQWFPGKLPYVNLGLNLWAYPKFFSLLQSGGAWWLWGPHVYLTVVAFAFFLASDISFSLGISTLLWGIVAGILARFSIPTASTNNEPNLLAQLNFGAYLGIFIIILYTGRKFYSEIFKKAFNITKLEEKHKDSVIGARIFLICITGMIVYLSVRAELNLLFAFLFTAIIVITFTIMSRIMAETGLFFVQITSYATAVLLGFLGDAAMGPQTILILTILSIMLSMDPRESLMPLLMNVFKLSESTGVKAGRIAKVSGFALIIGLAVALPVTLTLQYSKGANMTDKWAHRDVPSCIFSPAAKSIDKLNSISQLKTVETTNSYARLAFIQPNKLLLSAFFIGLGITLIFSLARLRFNWWPLHPVLFLVWNTYAMYCFAFSFFIGWIIKAMVMKFGGSKSYHNIKPLMIGIIAGECTVGVIMMIIGGIYYLITGLPPKTISIMPG